MAYEEAQRTRSDGKLLAARDHLRLCSRAICFRGLQTDCLEWLRQVEDSLPSVVFEVRDALHRETTQVRVFLDGQLVLSQLDGKAMVLDPGQHRFRFELFGAGSREHDVLIRQGEKNRNVAVSFAPPLAAVDTPTGAPSTPHDSIVSAASQRSNTAVVPRSPSPWPYVLGGVGVVTLAGFAYTGWQGNKRYDELKTTCAPTCSSDETSSLKTTYTVANVLAGVSLVSFGTGIWFFVQDHRSRRDAASQAPAKTSVALRAGPRLLQVVGAW